MDGNFRKVDARVLVVLLAAAIAGPAGAATPVGNADAYDLSIQIDILGVTSLDLTAPTRATIVDATASTNDAQSLVSIIDADPLNLITLSTGVTTAEAAFVAGPLSAVAARASVDDLELGALGLGEIDVLALGAGHISSQVALMGNCPDAPPQVNGLLDDFMFFNGFDEGNLSDGGAIGDGGEGGSGPGGLPPTGATLIDVQLSVLGIDVPTLPLNPPANTSIDLGALGIVGATLVLNEQTRSGDGITSLAVGSNALHLGLNALGLATADVRIAHSSVSLACP